MTVAGAIQVRDVVVDHQTAYGMVRSLVCPDLEVAPRSSVAVVGPSGCGKSTLLGLLAGLAVPTSGDVRIGSVLLSSCPDHGRATFRRQRLGMVHQADNLLPHLTVEENVGLALAIADVGKRSARADRVSAVLERLGLGALGGRLPDHLSGGQRQRAAVARAIIHRPAIILADEPTGSLDPVAAQGVMDLLLDVHGDLGATLVVVTHDLGMAAQLGRTVHLRAPARTAGGG